MIYLPDSHNKQPNFFIVGAPKSGTTALSEYLRQHPSIFMSFPKEPHYFAEDFAKHRYIETLSSYLDLFAKVEPHHIAVGEASVWYLYSHKALANIYKFNKNAKIIALLRNPVDMVYSLHSQEIYSLAEDELDFAKAWQLQSVRKHGERIPEYCKEPAFLQYKEVGSYSKQLERLFAIFPQEQVKIILFEDFVAKTAEIYEETLAFLGLSLPEKLPRFEPVNPNKVYRSRLLRKLLYYSNARFLNFISAKIKKILGIEKWGIKGLIQRINSKKVVRKPLSTPLRLELEKQFAVDVEKLQQLLEYKLTAWFDTKKY